MASSNIKICRYAHCLHDSKDIDISKDEYVQEKSTYFHKDCHRTKNDIQEIKVLWHDNISETVIFSQLNGILNQLIFKNRVSSDYIVFALKYVISHKNSYHLQYPPGLKWILEKSEIKDAYKKQSYKKINVADFTAKEDDTNTPTFSFNGQNSGFGNILKH